MRELVPRAGTGPSAACPGQIPAESLSAQHLVPVSNPQRDIPRPSRPYRAAIEFHTVRVWCQQGGPCVRAIIACATHYTRKRRFWVGCRQPLPWEYFPACPVLGRNRKGHLLTSPVSPNQHVSVLHTPTCPHCRRLVSQQLQQFCCSANHHGFESRRIVRSPRGRMELR